MNSIFMAPQEGASRLTAGYSNQKQLAMHQANRLDKSSKFSPVSLLIQAS
jgi:hypothetical protein